MNASANASADIAVIGLAVMGQNLILNINDHGFKVVAYNRTFEKTQQFIDGPAKDTNCLLYTSPSPRDKRQSRMPSSA